MGISPGRHCLYSNRREERQAASHSDMDFQVSRKAACTVVVVIVCLLSLTAATAQLARRRTVSKGPRAVGLVEVDKGGRAHLIPVVIMVDGKFYDASVYKADPVPMTLQPETVYEGTKAGLSQGLFTVRTGVQAPGWYGLGIWKT